MKSVKRREGRRSRGAEVAVRVVEGADLPAMVAVSVVEVLEKGPGEAVEEMEAEEAEEEQRMAETELAGTGLADTGLV